VVDGVLEHTRDRRLYSAVMNRTPLGIGDFAPQPPNRISLARIVVLIVEWQVTDLSLPKHEMGAADLTIAFAMR
jgi:hypothetical protein